MDYDKWKLQSGLEEPYICECCKTQTDEPEETTDDNVFLCSECSQDYDVCGKCNKVMYETQEYCHDEYCDSCCDKIADRFLDND